MSAERPDSSEIQLTGTSELESLIERIVERTIERLGHGPADSPFMTSKACARLIGVTPQHLCSMRARGEGPPWSGAGKWVRYHRSSVFDWLSNLPDGHTTHSESRPVHTQTASLTTHD